VALSLEQRLQRRRGEAAVRAVRELIHEDLTQKGVVNASMNQFV